MHNESHPKSHQTVRIKASATHPQEPNFGGAEFHLEDWWDLVAGKSWTICAGNPACIVYGIRSGLNGLPMDNEVVYGKVGHFGHLVHVSELEP